MILSFTVFSLYFSIFNCVNCLNDQNDYLTNTSQDLNPPIIKELIPEDNKQEDYTNLLNITNGLDEKPMSSILSPQEKDEDGNRMDNLLTKVNMIDEDNNPQLKETIMSSYSTEPLTTLPRNEETLNIDPLSPPKRYLIRTNIKCLDFPPSLPYEMGLSSLVVGVIVILIFIGALKIAYKRTYVQTKEIKEMKKAVDEVEKKYKALRLEIKEKEKCDDYEDVHDPTAKKTISLQMKNQKQIMVEDTCCENTQLLARAIGDDDNADMQFTQSCIKLPGANEPKDTSQNNSSTTNLSHEDDNNQESNGGIIIDTKLDSKPIIVNTCTSDTHHINLALSIGSNIKNASMVTESPMSSNGGKHLQEENEQTNETSAFISKCSSGLSRSTGEDSGRTSGQYDNNSDSLELQKSDLAEMPLGKV